VANCMDCWARLSTVDRRSGKAAYFIGCASCVPKIQRLWHYGPETMLEDDIDVDAEVDATEMTPYAINFAETDQKVIPDSGCRRSVARKRWHNSMRAALAKKGLTPVRRDIEENFKFGDGRVERSSTAVVYPVGFYGSHGSIDVAEVSSECPPFLSVETMGKLGVVLDFCRRWCP